MKTIPATTSLARATILRRRFAAVLRGVVWPWVGCLAAMLAGGFGTAHGQSGAAVKPLSPDAALYDQVRWSNDEYIRVNIKKHLDALQQISKELDALKETAPELSSYLDGGEQKEAEIANEVQGLLNFQETHNGRFRQWSGDDPDLARFLSVLKMSDRQVTELRNLYGPWPLHSLLWVIPSKAAQLEDHPIPKIGLRLDYAGWPEAAGDDARKFAFFYFLRKACLKEHASQRQFLDDQTGFEESWDVSVQDLVGDPSEVAIPRWKQLDYYTYAYLSPNQRPLNPGRPLVKHMVDLCFWKTINGVGPRFTVFYTAKLGLFRDLVLEMGRAPSVAADADPYLDFYSFLVRSFPCISAFEVGRDADNNHTFVIGYRGDLPARAMDRYRGVGSSNGPGGTTCFAGNSPVGMACALLERLATGREPADQTDLLDRLVRPILLLQFGLQDSDLRAPRLVKWRYQDVRVGYKGYWDFYRDLRAHIEGGGALSPPLGEDVP